MYVTHSDSLQEFPRIAEIAMLVQISFFKLHLKYLTYQKFLNNTGLHHIDPNNEHVLGPCYWNNK